MMVTINQADALYLGSTAVDAVYLGAERVWRRPSFTLDFIGQNYSLPFAFSRESVATYFVDSGNLVTAPADTLRLDHNPENGEPRGLFYEGEAQNYFPYSDLTDWPATNVQAQTFADGKFGGTFLITAPTATANAAGLRVNHIMPRMQTPETRSVYVKSAGAHLVSLSPYSEAVTTIIQFNIQTGEMSNFQGGNRVTSWDMEDVGGGWWRIWLEVPGTSSAYRHFAIHFSDKGRYDGGLDAGSGVYLALPQAEYAEAPSSYIPNIRAADQLSFDLPDGAHDLEIMFDNDSTAIIEGVSGSYTLPNDLPRPHIKHITGWQA